MPKKKKKKQNNWVQVAGEGILPTGDSRRRDGVNLFDKQRVSLKAPKENSRAGAGVFDLLGGGGGQVGKRRREANIPSNEGRPRERGVKKKEN